MHLNLIEYQYRHIDEILLSKTNRNSTRSELSIKSICDTEEIFKMLGRFDGNDKGVNPKIVKYIVLISMLPLLQKIVDHNLFTISSEIFKNLIKRKKNMNMCLQRFHFFLFF
jgi:hypothetical protein